jgi:hypothetical protein
MEKDSGVDVSLIEYNLSLSYEARLENHQRALDLLNEILKSHLELHELDLLKEKMKI